MGTVNAVTFPVASMRSTELLEGSTNQRSPSEPTAIERTGPTTGNSFTTTPEVVISPIFHAVAGLVAPSVYQTLVWVPAVTEPGKLGCSLVGYADT